MLDAQPNGVYIKKEIAINFTYYRKKLLLTVVTLVSPLILTLVVTDINLIRPILIDRQKPSVTNRPVIACKGILLQHLFFWVMADAYIILWDF